MAFSLQPLEEVPDSGNQKSDGKSRDRIARAADGGAVVGRFYAIFSYLCGLVQGFRQWGLPRTMGSSHFRPHSF